MSDHSIPPSFSDLFNPLPPCCRWLRIFQSLAFGRRRSVQTQKEVKRRERERKKEFCLGSQKVAGALVQKEVDGSSRTFTCFWRCSLMLIDGSGGKEDRSQTFG